MIDSKIVEFEPDFVRRLVVLLFECQKRIDKCYHSSKDDEALELSFVRDNIYRVLDILVPRYICINSDMLELFSKVSKCYIFPSQNVYKKAKA